nr:MAG: replication-associated protein [Canine circovirus]
MPPRQGTPLSYYMFTLNNPDSDELPPAFLEAAKYIAWQREQGAEGTPHLQGYIALKKPMRITALRRLLPAHFEGRRGTHDQAKDYVTKEDSRQAGPWFHGDDSTIPRKRGERTDLKAVAARIDEGASYKDIAVEFPSEFIKYHRGVREYIQVQTPSRPQNVTPQVFIYWGPPGTGKTYRASHDHPEAYWMSKPQDSKTFWYDGYIGQSTIVFDEFYGWLPYDHILRVLDRYPMKLPVKGAMVELSATTFVFTSNRSWQEWYPRIGDLSALERRINEFATVVHMTQPFQPTQDQNNSEGTDSSE